MKLTDRFDARRLIAVPKSSTCGDQTAIPCGMRTAARQISSTCADQSAIANPERYNRQVICSISW